MAAFFILLLLFAACGFGVVRLLDPAEPSRGMRRVTRALLLALGTVVVLFAWAAWEMR